MVRAVMQPLRILGAAGLLGALLGTAGAQPAVSPQHLDGDGKHLCLLQDKGARAVRRGGLAAEARGPQEDAKLKFSCDGGAAFSDFSATIATEQYFWANKNGDAISSGASRFEAPSNISQGPAWRFKDETGSIMSAHPCIDEKKDIYLSHRNGRLRKFCPHGTLKWTNSENYDRVLGDLAFGSAQASQLVTGGPLLMDGAIYTASMDGYVLCVDMVSGKTLWRRRVAAAMAMDSWSIAGRSGIVLVPSMSEGLDVTRGNDEVVALDGGDGRVLWRWLTPHGKRTYNWLASFADAPASVLFATSEGRPYRVRLCDGETLWEGEAFSGQPGEAPDFSTGGMAVGPNGLAYVTSNVNRSEGAPRKSGRLSAYDVSTGRLVWKQEQSLQANNAPSVGILGGGNGSQPSVVIALGDNPSFPDPVAEAAGHWADGSPVAWHTEVRAFDAATGEPLAWRFAPPPHRKPEAEGDREPDHICLPDAWSNGAIDSRGTYFVGHMSGNLFALRDADGDGALSADEVTRYYGGRCHQGSPGIAPGLLVAAPCDGVHVYSGDAAP